MPVARTQLSANHRKRRLDRVGATQAPAQLPGAHSADAVCRNVKRWQPGDQLERWVSSALLPAEQQFRRIVGYRTLLVFLSILDARGICCRLG